ncbi:MAG: hypothetical protein CMG74_12960 [Candidatus Marinimicrobia bacterium]|nr:hypothetical protein [Candidatus Neomarinimicrobiota bacterium]|tara:strand:+ start:18696 stop:19250 length:555 start_codon:yes stop_codon:yes gene_type:complete
MENLRLDTENYFLQSLNESDVSERYLSWLHDFEVSKTLEVDGKSQTLETIKDYINWHDNKLKFLFGIFTIKEKKHIGTFSVTLNVEHKRATIGVMIGDKDYWGTGVVNEARAKIIDWLFDIKKMNKIEAGPMSINFPAIFNFINQGWENEGIMKSHYLIDGKSVDSILYGMTRKLWKDLKKQYK